MKLKNILKENTILLAVYCIVFFSLITKEAIYSPDTSSYLLALPYRHLGYVIFVKTITFLFSDNFDLAIIGFQSVFGLFAVNFFLKKVAKILSLNTILFFVLLVVLLFPFFSPLHIANNVCPEGLSYSLYLLFVALNLEFLFNHNTKVLKFVIITFLALVFTRGQFLFTSLIFAFVYFLQNRKQVFKKPHLIHLSILLLIPIVAVLGELSYHKLKDGIFMTTPFGFVNTSTSAFYVANSDDINFITNEDDKAIFKSCYESLVQQKLLLSQNKAENYRQQYDHFQKNLTTICNLTIHESGKKYYLQKNSPALLKKQITYAKAYYDIDKTCKNLTFILIKQNFKKWIQLYFANILHGFNNWFIFTTIVFAFIFSLIKLIFSYSKWHSVLFIFSSLSILNAMISALFTYSIPRLLFYNYPLIFLCFIILIQLLTREFKMRKTKGY
ncbi:hypothetical protein [Psychroserpens mesophilus]|uniref:hypothetical protein n=1 Tax=Psychroserpens mesophilus TaxID=325473 RepID=UPI003D6531AA